MGRSPVSDGERMVREMDPVLTHGRFAFVTYEDEPPPVVRDAAIAMFREPEGVSLIVAAPLAPEEPAVRLVTLNVRSALDGVGLTAASSSALAAEGIPANVVAAYHHDHIFVPEARADDALATLRRLASGVRKS